MEKIKNKAEGYILVEAVLGIITFTLLSMAFMTIFSGSFNQLAAARTAAQAQQYAELDAELLRLVNYEYLNDDGVLAEYSLHKSRGTIQSVADAGSWQDEIIIGNETYTADGETNKYRIATINVYRNSSDTLPRASLEVPLSSQASGMPIGTVITWPSEGNPTYGGEWLECNGQEVPAKYTALRKLMTKVPDYRGMFLRGHGSRSYSQVNGALDYFTVENSNGNLTYGSPTSTLYSSGTVGEIQGDAARRNVWDCNTAILQLMLGNATSYQGNLRVAPGWGDWGVVDLNGCLRGGHHTTSGVFGSILDVKQFYLHVNPKHYKYRLISSTSTSGEGENAKETTTYELEEYIENADADEGLFVNGFASDIGWDTMLNMPTANEIRPVNVAVRFFIKAR